MVEKFLILLFILSVVFFFIFLYTADLISTVKLVAILGLLGIAFLILFQSNQKLGAKN